MKLLVVLLMWSQGAYAANKNASAAASSSAAAEDAKGAAAQEKERHQYPEMPANIVAALGDTQRIQQADNLKKIYQWLDADSNNVNAVYRTKSPYGGFSETPLLIMIIGYYGHICDIAAPLLRKILSLNPDVRNQEKLGGGLLHTALEAICLTHPTTPTQHKGGYWSQTSPPGTEEEHLGFVKQIIDLLIEQAMRPAAIEAELKKLLAKTEEGANPYEGSIINAALEYLHDIQAAPIVEEEMTQNLGFPRELGGMTAEYLDPSYKKHKKHMHHHRKSGDSAK